MKTFDLLVIGSGAGLEVSSAAAEQGRTVAVIENGPFGGTCLNRGCIPSKMLIRSADVIELVRRAHLWGIRAEVLGVDWSYIVDRVTGTIDSDAEQIEEGNRQAENIAVFKGTARFTGHKTVEVERQEIRAETVVIAAGSRPRIPDIPGLTDVTFITSDEALRMPSQPKRLIIVGGGFVAAELAHFFGALGTEVAIVQRGPVLLGREDEELAQRFTDIYAGKFELFLNSKVTRLRKAGQEIEAELNGGERKLTGDSLLFATGRVPNTDLLNIGATGVGVDDKGFIKADDFLETNVKGIWTLGDIAGRYMLRHSANLEAAFVAHNILNYQRKLAIDYHAMPHAVFASPQVGSAGLTEQEVRSQGRRYGVGKAEYIQTAYGSFIEDRDGLVKVIVDDETKEVLGCHIIGTDASVLIQEAVNLMRLRGTADAITNSIYIHPALSEVVQRAFGSIESVGQGQPA